MEQKCSSDVVRLIVSLAEKHSEEMMALCIPIVRQSADVVRQSYDTSYDRKKEYDRNRQSEIRRLRRSEKTGDILTSLTSLSSSLLTEEPLKKESKKESSGIRARDASAVPDDYPENYGDLFWQAYPRKEEKISAMKKLANLRKSGIVTFADLMAGLERYCSVDREPQFIKGPTVWLNKGCWADETQTGAIHGQRTANTRASGSDAILAAAARAARKIVGDGPMAGPEPETEFSGWDGAEPRRPDGAGAPASIFAAPDERRASSDGRVFEGEIIPPDKASNGVSFGGKPVGHRH
jgi:hypothetical protein